MVKDLINVAKYKRINKKLIKLNDELIQNNDFLFKSYETLKEKLIFLTRREKKLQTIEQMVANKEDFRKIRTFIKGE